MLSNIDMYDRYVCFNYKWDRLFKKGPSKIYGRQSLKIWKKQY